MIECVPGQLVGCYIKIMSLFYIQFCFFHSRLWKQVEQAAQGGRLNRCIHPWIRSFSVMTVSRPCRSQRNGGCAPRPERPGAFTSALSRSFTGTRREAACGLLLQDNSAVAAVQLLHPRAPWKKGRIPLCVFTIAQRFQHPREVFSCQIQPPSVHSWGCWVGGYMDGSGVAAPASGQVLHLNGSLGAAAALTLREPTGPRPLGWQQLRLARSLEGSFLSVPCSKPATLP